MLGLLVPMQVHAVGQDSVGLSRDGDKVAVSLEMSNAPQEKITTVSVSLEVKPDGQEKVTVDFQFSAQLSGTEHGYVYHEDTGRLDIYVASVSSLFSEEKLNLGSVRVCPEDASKTVSANISYCENSFRTANSSYGDKTPVVEDEIASVDIEVGKDADHSAPSDGNTGSTGDNYGGGTGVVLPNHPGDAWQGGGNNQAGDNRNQGLYDETTRFVNNPASAQLLTADVIRRAKPDAALIDMSAVHLNGAVTGRRGPTAVAVKPGGLSQTKETGKVSVILPENGPAGILIAGENSASGTTGNAGGILAGISGQDSVEEEENAYTEIILDQEKGGAVENQKNVKKTILVAVCMILAVILSAGGIFFLIRGLRMPVAGGRKKRRKKKRKRKKSKRKQRKRGKYYVN